tara:strand:- start:20016 stop:21677 length:1662 start_codon:yes stop_codon:yes gene_type:complete
MLNNLLKSINALKYIASHISYIPLLIAAVIASTLFESVSVFMFSELLNLVNTSRESYIKNPLPSIPLIYVISFFILLSYLVVIVLKMFWLRKASLIGYELSTIILKSLYNSDIQSQYDTKNETILNALLPEIQRLASHVIFRIITLIANGVLLIFLSILLYFLIGNIFIISFLIFLPYIFSLFLFRKNLSDINVNIKLNHEKRVSSLNDYIQQTRLLHFNNLGIYNINAFEKSSLSIGEKIGTSNVISQLPKYFVEIGIVIVLFIYISLKESFLTIHLGLNIETIGLIFISLFKIIPAIQEIYRSMTSISANILSMDSVYNLHESILKNKKLYGLQHDEKLSRKIESIETSDIIINIKGKDVSCPNFKIKKGESLILKGPSGVGKTSILDCLAGLTRPYKGKLFFNTQLITNKNVNDYRNMISYCPQKNYINNEYMFYEKYNNNLTKDYALSLFKKLNIGQHFNLFLDQNNLMILKNLSGGELRKIGIIRTIISSKNVLIFDEPLNDLDADSINLVIDIFDTLKRDGNILIFVSHNPSLDALADKELYITYDK